MVCRCEGGIAMLKHMKELQKGFIPTPDHAEEQVKIEQIFDELKFQHGGGPRPP